MSKVIGIDISKQTFDAAYQDRSGKWHHQAFSNSKEGFKQLLGLLTKESKVVMEATGPYYLQLADYVYQQGIKVSVINPLVIRRYAQMKMLRSKTDKKDAKTIACFGMEQELKPWAPQDKNISRMRQILTVLEGYDKQRTMLKNQYSSFESSGIFDKKAKQSLRSMLNKLEKEIAKLEKELEKIAADHYSGSLELLKSIPSIGTKTAIALIMVSNDFKHFENYKQLISYVGLSPRIYQSGTSVKGKGHICKMGNGRIRKLLYLCTLSAKKYNKPVGEMYERLKAKGKPEKVIRMALANKLLKQAFAIVKNKQRYDENYIGVTLC